MSLFTRRTVSLSTIYQDLEAAGIQPGDRLLVHSSMRSLGFVREGMDAVIHLMVDLLTRQGTLVMPTFTFSLMDWGMPPFDMMMTKSRVGSLTEAFRKQDGVFRSAHPTHSFAAWGAEADYVIGAESNHAPLGKGSPLDRFRELDGKILLIGVGQNRNSTVHLAESLAEVPYLNVPFSETLDYDTAWSVTARSTAPEYHAIFEMPGSSEGFSVLDELLIQMGVVTSVTIGNASCQIMESQKLCDTVVRLLKEDPALLLRPEEKPSEITVKRRRYLERNFPHLKKEHGR